MADEFDTPPTGAADEGPESIVVALWRLLQSVRTTIWVLPVLAVATTIGAVIPQKKPADYYDLDYGAAWGRIITGLGFDNIYNSTWFIILVGILLANLAACVARSFRRAARGYRGPAPEALAKKLASGRGAGCYEAASAASDVKTRLLGSLRRARYAVSEHDGPPGQSWLLVRRWPLAHYAGIVTHLAIFSVAVGAVIGRLPWTSLDRYLTIVEGETCRDADGKLGFDVRLDDFRMDYYPGTDQPATYESDVALMAGDDELTKGMATVNKQVVYRGLALGQASWGLAGVELTVKGPGGAEERAQMSLTEAAGPHGGSTWVFEQQGAIAMIDNEKAALVGAQFTPDTKTGSTYPRNPAVSLQIVTGLAKGEHGFEDVGDLTRGEERTVRGYTIRFDDVVYVSTLSARRDPGLPLVWIGFILISVGMTLMFYVRPRAFLVEVGERGGDVRIAPLGREFAEADRRVIESACEARLTPMSAAEGAGRRRRAPS